MLSAKRQMRLADNACDCVHVAAINRTQYSIVFP